MVLAKILGKIVGDTNEKEIKKLQPLVDRINEYETRYQAELNEADISAKTESFKKRIADGESLDDLLPEAFALVKFACRKLMGKSWEVRGNETI